MKKIIFTFVFGSGLLLLQANSAFAQYYYTNPNNYNSGYNYDNNNYNNNNYNSNNIPTIQNTYTVVSGCYVYYYNMYTNVLINTINRCTNNNNNCNNNCRCPHPMNYSSYNYQYTYPYNYNYNNNSSGTYDCGYYNSFGVYYYRTCPYNGGYNNYNYYGY